MAELSKTASTSFEGLSLSQVMLSALEKAGYEQPTPVQAGLIPHALEGVDVMGQARTGTGKTAAFAIPILERLVPRKGASAPQALVLVPTRELAVQVRDEFVKLAPKPRVYCIAVYGGKPIRQQIENLKRSPQVVVGTPGRVLDHFGRRTLQLGQLSCVVLDEADRMLDIGFRPDIEKILSCCPNERQTLLFSATVPPTVVRLAQRYMRKPLSLDFSEKDLSVSTIRQFYFTVDNEQKFELLASLLAREDPQQAIIFCRTKRRTDSISRRLGRRFDSVSCIHGDLQQSVRDRVMARFREGKIRVLVATDVVGRGIDVTRISHIVNYDVPQFCDDYVHRVGRTGRMGREGVAFTFITPEEGGELTRIEMRIDRLLERDEIHGFQPVALKSPPPPVEDEAAEKDMSSPPPLSPRGRRTRRHRRAL